MKNPVNLTLHWNELRALVEFASKDETRYILNGVCLEIHPAFVFFVATDGRRIGIYRHVLPQDECNQVDEPTNIIVPVKAIMATKPSKDHRWFIEIATLPVVPNVRPTVEYDLTIRTLATLSTERRIFRAVVGNYPAWRQVLPTKDAAPSPLLSFNPTLLEGFSRAATYLCPKMAGITVRAHGDDKSAMSISFNGTAEFYGMLMPVRGETLRAPDWLQQAPAPTFPAKDLNPAVAMPRSFARSPEAPAPVAASETVTPGITAATAAAA